MMYTWNDGAYLMHHGIKGQRWGVRRFQNEDGTLTAAGYERYGRNPASIGKRNFKKQYMTYSQSDAVKNGNMAKLAKEINSEISETQEAKDYYGVLEIITMMAKQVADDYGDYNPKIVFPKEVADYYERAESAYTKKVEEIFQSHIYEMAGVTLSELGYDDTESGRKWLVDSGILEL